MMSPTIARRGERCRVGDLIMTDPNQLRPVISSESPCPFDFADLERFAKDVPHDSLRQLRRFTPVYWNPAPTLAMPNDGFWLITRHSDIVHIEENPALFSSHLGL